MGITNKNNDFEYLDLVDTIDRLNKLCKKLNISSILDGHGEQIEIIMEIKNRIENLEVERVESSDFGNIKYEA
tara:strand:+ start:291 stop:509 length:219 start_codon:yes stop_codon:yes gene_type:complete